MVKSVLVMVTAALFATLFFGGCYDVTYPTSYACNAEVPFCPSGYECDETDEVCVKEGSVRDKGKDAPVDAGPDVRQDRGLDVTTDAGPDLSPDLGPDLATDLASDLGPDLVADLALDLGPETAPDATPDIIVPDLVLDLASDLASDLTTGDGGGPVVKWVTVKAGKYQMGSTSAETCFQPSAHLGYLESQHAVTLTRDFAISSHAVTQAQLKSARGYGPSSFTSCPHCPVENLTWSEAAAYCNALSLQSKHKPCYVCNTAFGPQDVKCSNTSTYAGPKIYTCPGYRLPTEAEYEYAHRAGTTTPLTNGKLTNCGTDPVADANGWYKYNAKSQTHVVGQKPANALGLYDMAGNVFTWCQDSWSDDLGSAAQTDPVGTTVSTLRAVRGGSWASPASYLRTAFRHAAKGSDRFKTVGLRCVRTLKP